MQVTVRYVNPPKEGRTNGSLRLSDNSYISVPPQLLPLFQGTENTTVEIATRSFPGSNGQTIVMAESGPGGVRAPAPPRQSYNNPAVSYTAPAAGQGGPVQSAPPPRNVDTDKHIFVTGIVGRAMGSGKFVASEIRVLTQAALEAFEMLSAPKLPKVITPPIETWTNNTRTTPNSEPGDPGPAELQ